MDAPANDIKLGTTAKKRGKVDEQSKRERKEEERVDAVGGRVI